MCQFAAQSAALLFLLAPARLMPTAGRANKAQALEARDRQMTEESAGPQLSDSQTPSQVWGFNSVRDNVFGTLVLWEVATPPGECSMFSGAARGAGEVLLAFPPDCFPWAPTDGLFTVRAAALEHDRGPVSEELASEWSDGHCPHRARWVQGCPIRLSFGCVGGRRFSALTSGPTSSDLWEAMTEGRRNANSSPLRDVDERGSTLDSLSQRAKKPSAGGDVAANSSSAGRPCSMPPAHTPRTAAQMCSGRASPSGVAEESAIRYYSHVCGVARCRKSV